MWKYRDAEMRRRSGPARIGHALFFVVIVSNFIYNYQGTILKIYVSTGLIVALNHCELLGKSYKSSETNIMLLKNRGDFT